MAKDVILETCSEYVELYTDARDKQFGVKYNMEGPPILKRE